MNGQKIRDKDMTYKLTIVSFEPNHNFEEELKDFREKNRYGRTDFNDSGPQKEIVRNTLEVHLTEEQFETVKKAVISTFQ